MFFLRGQAGVRRHLQQFRNQHAVIVAWLVPRTPNRIDRRVRTRTHSGMGGVELQGSPLSRSTGKLCGVGGLGWPLTDKNRMPHDIRSSILLEINYSACLRILYRCQE